MQPGQAEIDLPGYVEYWNSALKKGYSGTAIFAKKEPIAVTMDIGKEEHDREGRVITLEYDNFYLANTYAPNSQRGLVRLDYRMTWQDDFLAYLKFLTRETSGDLWRYEWPPRKLTLKTRSQI